MLPSQPRPLADARHTKIVQSSPANTTTTTLVTEKLEPELPMCLKPYEDVFSTDAAGILPEHGRLDHAIETIDDKDPPYGPLYNLSQTELQAHRGYLEDASNKGWIRRSTSPAAAPVLFVPKKDGDSGFV